MRRPYCVPLGRPDRLCKDASSDFDRSPKLVVFCRSADDKVTRHDGDRRTVRETVLTVTLLTLIVSLPGGPPRLTGQAPASLVLTAITGFRDRCRSTRAIPARSTVPADRSRLDRPLSDREGCSGAESVRARVHVGARPRLRHARPQASVMLNSRDRRTHKPNSPWRTWAGRGRSRLSPAPAPAPASSRRATLPVPFRRQSGAGSSSRRQ